MPLAATLAAAECHDQLIAAAFHEVVCSHAADPERRRLALMQARLPVGIAGNGMSAMKSIRLAAVLGAWAQCWEPLHRLCPQVTQGIALGGPVQDLPPSLHEVSMAHTVLMRQHAAAARRYAAAPSTVCHDKNGAGYLRPVPPWWSP
jgi:hypothetical protein